ncbi:MAG: tautomerase family protein [Pseudomonadota bacterium]
MPLYLCNFAQGAIADAAKPRIAADITRIHCAVTDAPPQFVHAFFLEDAAHQPLNGKSAKLLGSIRAGRSEAQRQQIIDEMSASIQAHAGLEQNAIEVVLTDVPASWVMEGGEIYPEPGEEAEWLAQHEARHADAPAL